MKAKIHAILNNEPQLDEAYDRVVRLMPDIIGPGDKATVRMGERATRYEIHIASQVRSTARAAATEETPIQSTRSPNQDDDEDIQDVDAAVPGDVAIDPRLMDAGSEADQSGSEITREIAQLDQIDSAMDTEVPEDEMVATA